MCNCLDLDNSTCIQRVLPINKRAVHTRPKKTDVKKKTDIHAKELCISAKKPYISAKELGIRTYLQTGLVCLQTRQYPQTGLASVQG